jgi:beta-glucosidase
MLLLLLSVSTLLFSECMGSDPVSLCDVVIGSHPAVTPIPQTADWWMPRHQAVLDRVAQGNVDLLMIGDSITHGWEKSGKGIWEKYYAPRNAVNLGFSGDRTEHVLWRLKNGEIENIKPKLAIVMIGTNNSGGGSKPEKIAEGIQAIVCELRAKLPETKVLILAIFPRRTAEQRNDKTVINAVYNPQWAKNDKTSELAAELADGKMIFYLNINKALLNEQGELTRAVMPDLLHPGEKGYQIWAEAMEPTIAKLMGEKK